MNYENVDTQPSVKMNKLPSVLFLCECVCGGGGGRVLFWREGGVGYTLRKGQHSLYP